METLVLVLAALILVAGVLLWRADAAKKRPPLDTPLIDAPVERADAPEPESPEPESEPEPEPVTEPDPQPEPEPEPAPEPEPEPEQRGVDKHPFLHALPGSQRRERRHWAARHGFDYIKEDAFLTDEWSRGAAATGAMARDVVSGMAEGYETHLVDLAGVPVMAMRRGVGSEVVIDARRGDDPAQSAESEDLLEIDTVAGFRVLSNTAGVAQRFIDERVRAALEAMPEVVRAVWLESDWVLAQTVRGTKAEDWDEMLAPLALIADAARVLPPRGGTEPELKIADFTPSRHMEPLPVDASFGGGVDVDQRPEGPDPSSAPPVSRPDEPLELPSRSRPQARGVVEPRSLGGDEVDAIADGRGPSASDPTRMPRRQDRGPSIFGD